MASKASQLSPNQQKKYLGGLKGAAREARAAEILYRREHRSDKPFKTDEGQPTRRTSHAAAFERKYGRHATDTADAAKLTGIPKKILDEVYARGMAAWQTGHRPGASQHAWALARVYSFATGGPTAQGPDADLAKEAKLTRNPLLAKPMVDPSQHKLHRAGDRHTKALAAWAGLTQDLYEGVHVSPSPAAAAAYALGRLKVSGDDYEVTDAPVLIGISADCAKSDLGDVDMLTCAQNIVQAAEAYPDLDIENDDLQDLFSDYIAREGFDDYLGLVQSLGDWANRPSADDFADAVLKLQEFCTRKCSDKAVRDKAIELAKAIVPQVRWDGDVADDCVVAVVVLPPYKPMEDVARQNEPFPYDTSAEEEFSSEPLDRAYLDSFIRNGWKVLWGDPKKAKFWHGTSASLAAKALPSIVNKYAANELSFDPTPYREEFEDEDLEENPPSEGYSPLSEGSRAVAYVKGKHVEIAVGPKFSVQGRPHMNSLAYDLSREVMIRARQLATPAARKHLPEIERLRAEIEQVPVYDDKDWNKQVGEQTAIKFWYRMPYYPEADWSDAAIKQVEALQTTLTSEVDTQYAALKRVPQGLREAVAAIAEAAQDYAKRAYVLGWDLEWKNFSNNNGTIVLRDPLGSSTTLETMLELWHDAGMPTPAEKNPADQTDTPAFKRWFGNSKVVDKNGKPRVLYHGTHADFTVFDTSGKRRSQSFGAMFTPSKAYATNYGRKEHGGKVLAVYLRIEKPFDDKNKKHRQEWEDKRLPLEGWVQYAKRAGYDGAITMLNEYVVFDPNQIKSATNNRGTFDPHDADIRNPADQTHIPPGPVAAAARRGLELRASQPPSNRCCTSVGLRRAGQLAARQPVSEDTLRRMVSYFRRHEVDKQGKDWNKGTSKGLQAWLCWGGDEGYAWARRVLGV